MGKGRGDSFVALERKRQAEFFCSGFEGKIGYQNCPYRLLPAHKSFNLFGPIRLSAAEYFGRGIAWHTHANHGLPSQVCCLNFLMPLAEKPELLSSVIGSAFGIAPPSMLEVKRGPGDRPWFVGFEWNGREDYLSEANARGVRTRGSNSTSADAIVRFESAGRIETALIEWKYTESYGPPIEQSGNETRRGRYASKAFDPAGPVRNDLELSLDDFFYEPFCQLLRQQMLAYRMALAREDGAERVRVLHISPAANLALRRITSPKFRSFGDDAFSAFSAVLKEPADFVSVSTEQLFWPLVRRRAETDEWAGYLARRYQFLRGP